LSWTPPRSSSKTVGSVRTRISRSRQAATTLARSVPGAEGIAITTSSGSLSSRISLISSVVPSTLRPSIRMPRLRGSSSMKPIAVEPMLGLSCSSRTTIWPPEPAPITSTSRLGTRSAREGRSTISRTARRAPAIKIRVSTKSVTSTERGRVGENGLITAKTITRIALERATARRINMKSRPLT
jgi:hypothetical protein